MFFNENIYYLKAVFHIFNKNVCFSMIVNIILTLLKLQMINITYATTVLNGYRGSNMNKINVIIYLLKELAYELKINVNNNISTLTITIDTYNKFTDQDTQIQLNHCRDT